MGLVQPGHFLLVAHSWRGFKWGFRRLGNFSQLSFASYRGGPVFLPRGVTPRGSFLGVPRFMGVPLPVGMASGGFGQGVT